MWLERKGNHSRVPVKELGIRLRGLHFRSHRKGMGLPSAMGETSRGLAEGTAGVVSRNKTTSGENEGRRVGTDVVRGSWRAAAGVLLQC